MITIRGNAARAYGHTVAVEGRDPIKLVVCDGMPAVIPASWVEHASDRITASPGDVVKAEGRHWQVSQVNLDRDGKVSYLFKVDVKEGGERILHEIAISEDEASLFACDPEGRPTIGDVVEMRDPNRPKKPLRAIARNSSNGCASQVFMPNGTIAYAPSHKASQRATPATLGEAKHLNTRALDEGARAMTHQRSARTDFRVWAMLLVGVGFAWAGSTIDPAANCNGSGECAPWLVPVAKWMGIAFAMSGLGALLVNPRRGSMIDPETGDLVWWQGRAGNSAGREGRIHPSRISRIRIVKQSDADDGVHLYDEAGIRQAHFDGEVIPRPYEDWAERLKARWPHIVVEVKD